MSANDSRTILTGNGFVVELARTDDGWIAKMFSLSARGSTPKVAYKKLKSKLKASHYRPAKRAIYTVSVSSGEPTVSLFIDGKAFDGSGATVRDAYLAAWRAYRLRNVDVVALVADLHRTRHEIFRQMSAALENLLRYVRDYAEANRVNRQKRTVHVLRHQRYARLIRERRAMRTAWSDLNDENKRLRKQLNDTEYELGVIRELLRGAEKDAEALRSLIVQARADDPYLRFHLPEPLGPRGLNAACKALISLARKTAEYDRRASAAEARIEEWKRTVERLQREQANL